MGELCVILQDIKEECCSGPKEYRVLNEELSHRIFSDMMPPRYMELVPKVPVKFEDCQDIRVTTLTEGLSFGMSEGKFMERFARFKTAATTGATMGSSPSSSTTGRTQERVAIRMKPSWCRAAGFSRRSSTSGWRFCSRPISTDTWVETGFNAREGGSRGSTWAKTEMNRSITCEHQVGSRSWTTAI